MNPDAQRGFFDAPNDGKKNGAAAEQVDEDEDLLPHGVLGAPLLRLLYDDLCDVRQDLKRGGVCVCE